MIYFLEYIFKGNIKLYTIYKTMLCIPAIAILCIYLKRLNINGHTETYCSMLIAVDRQWLLGAQGGKDKQEKHRRLGWQSILCGSRMVNTCHDRFVQTHRSYTESKCKLQTLGDFDLSMKFIGDSKCTAHWWRMLTIGDSSIWVHETSLCFPFNFF